MGDTTDRDEVTPYVKRWRRFDEIIELIGLVTIVASITAIIVR